MNLAAFQANPPPGVLGSSETPPVVPTDTLAPAAPQITAFTPDTGTVGDKTTRCNDPDVKWLCGGLAAPSRYSKGQPWSARQKAGANGAWTLTTAQLASGTHGFTAKATDAAGNTSSASSLLSVKVNPTSQPPVASPPANSTNLLVNGSFETASLVAMNTGRWGAFSSINGWTAVNGSKIELWNNLEEVQATNGGNFGELDYAGARDGFYQDVKTVAGQRYDLSFDARSRPGSTSSTTTVEVDVWNGAVVGTVPPGYAWKNHDFSVVGTAGQDRLTFRGLQRRAATALVPCTIMSP